LSLPTLGSDASLVSRLTRTTAHCRGPDPLSCGSRDPAFEARIQCPRDGGRELTCQVTKISLNTVAFLHPARLIGPTSRAGLEGFKWHGLQLGV
jgi:hypothetical protein